jgi:hypothetical protein
MVGQLRKAVNNEVLPADTKIKNFLDALRGDPNAVVLDRWMLDALNMKESGGSLPPDKYKIYEQVVRQLARDNEMSPAEFQAAVWEGARVRSMHVKEAAGGRAASSKTGSARPLEDLVERKLGGMSLDEYVASTTGKLKEMDNLYKGLKPVRTGIVKNKETGGWDAGADEASGYTFNPHTFETAKHSGNTVTLISHNTDRKFLYPARILKFKENVAGLIDELESKGLKPTIGVFRLTDDAGKPTGQFSVDLNVMVDNPEQAAALGKLNRQDAFAQLGEGGEFIGNTPTGYNPKVDGKKFLPPKDHLAQPAWYKQQSNRVRIFLKKAGLTK